MEPQQQRLALLQLCFDEAEFGEGEESFDAVAFVAEKHQHVPLAVLEKDLRTYSTYLQSSILRYVHDDVHEAFVNVSGQLVGMQDVMRGVYNPIDDTLRRLLAARTTLETACQSVNQKVQMAQLDEEERTYYNNMLEVVLLHTRLRSALSEETKLPLSGEGQRNEVAKLQSATSDFFRLRILGQELQAPNAASEAECNDAQKLIQEDISLFFGALGQRLVQTVTSFIDGELVACSAPSAEQQLHPKGSQQSRQTSLTALLSVYDQLGASEQFAVLMKERVVKSLVEDVITWKAAAQARQNPDESEQMLRALVSRLEQALYPCLPLFRDVLPGVNVIASVVWPAVCDAMLKRMVFLFAPGIPTTFHRNFVAAHTVLASLEAQCTSVKELAELRCTEEMATWQRKWNLDVYHTLRRTELQDRLTKALATPLPTTAPRGKKSGWTFSALLQVQSCAEWLFSSDVFLYPLSQHFLRDAAQCIFMGVRMLVQHCDQHVAAEPGIVVHAVDDLKRFRASISEVLLPLVAAALRESTPAEPSHLASSLQQVISSIIDRGVFDILTNCKRWLVEQCMVSLSNVRSVKAAYSMTKKPLPSAPSWFVSSSLDVLVAYRKYATDTCVFSAEELNKLMRDVIDELTQRFRALIKEILVAARKAQESLEKLRRKKELKQADATTPVTPAPPSGARPTPDTASDRDKMVVQLYLDIHAYGDLLRPFGVAKESHPVMESLFALVRRANWVLGDDIPEPPEVDEE